MAFRSILISKATRINLDLNNIVVLYNDEKFFINLDEINVIVVEDPRCLVSLKLLTEIGEKGITLVLTNASHVPVCSLETLYNNSRAPKRFKEQINWNVDTKEYLWTEIVKQKIKMQKNVLIKTNKLSKIDIMNNYYNSLTTNDLTNREGLASRTYFKELFGQEFKRFNEDIINFSLNYAYQIIRAKIAQEIVASGYNPCLGINHTSEYNNYNLADDFIEVYRPIIDYYVYKILLESDENNLTSSIKEKLLDIINNIIIYESKNQKIYISISLYIQNIFYFLLTGNVNKIIFPSFNDDKQL